MYDHENSPEPELIRRAKRGDVKAFSRLYAGIYKDLYRFALCTTRHTQDAEDAVSEAVAAAYENIGKLQKEESFRNWMFTILNNQCRKILKNRNKTVSADEQEETGREAESAAGQEMDYAEQHDVRAAFAALEEEERMIVAFSVFGGYRSEEIASMLDKNAGTLQLVNLDNHTRTFNVIDMENGDLLIAYESYSKALELNHMMDEKREHVKAMIMEYNKKNAQYELLHSKSMLDCCSEFDIYKHEVEINKALERLMPYNDVPCDVIINYKDLKHKDTIKEVMTIGDFFNDRIQCFDFKNGVDFKLDKDNDEFIVICYGNAYEKDGRCHHEEVDVRLKIKDEHKSFNKIFKKKSQSKKVGIKLRR